MKIYILSQFDILIAFFFLNFGEAEFSKILSKRGTNNAIIGTGPTGSSSNEKNDDVIGDTSLKSIVLEYEMQLKKELERRKSEKDKNEKKVKRENSEAEIEEFEDPILLLKSYKIVRKEQSPDMTPLDNPEDLITQFQNKGKEFVQNIKEVSAAVGLDVKKKLNALQIIAEKELSPDSSLSDGSDDQKKFKSPSDDYLSNRLYATLPGNINATFVKISSGISNVRDGSSSSMAPESHETGSTKNNNSSNNDFEKIDFAKEDNVKRDGVKKVNAKDDDNKNTNIKGDDSGDTQKDAVKNDDDEEGDAKVGDARKDNGREDIAMQDDTKDVDKEGSVKKKEGGHKRKRRNARKDESETESKGKSKRKMNNPKEGEKKNKENNGNKMEDNLECKIMGKKYDDGKNETKKDDKHTSSKSRGESVNKEEMNDMDDVKEGTDYDENEDR